MKKTAAVLAATVFCAASSAAYAMYTINNKGTWPESWPEELEPLRKQSRTITGSLLNTTHYEIPFTSREDFESAWPHLLKARSKGAPVILLRGPREDYGPSIGAGVRVWPPLARKGNRGAPAAPIPGQTNVRARWLSTGFIELVVDGELVDLNRIPLPEDAPIIDRRFEEGDH